MSKVGWLYSVTLSGSPNIRVAELNITSTGSLAFTRLTGGRATLSTPLGSARIDCDFVPGTNKLFILSYQNSTNGNQGSYQVYTAGSSGLTRTLERGEFPISGYDPKFNNYNLTDLSGIAFYKEGSTVYAYVIQGGDAAGLYPDPDDPAKPKYQEPDSGFFCYSLSGNTFTRELSREGRTSTDEMGGNYLFYGKRGTVSSVNRITIVNDIAYISTTGFVREFRITSTGLDFIGNINKGGLEDVTFLKLPSISAWVLLYYDFGVKTLPSLTIDSTPYVGRAGWTFLLNTDSDTGTGQTVIATTIKNLASIPPIRFTSPGRTIVTTKNDKARTITISSIAPSIGKKTYRGLCYDAKLEVFDSTRPLVLSATKGIARFLRGANTTYLYVLGSSGTGTTDNPSIRCYRVYDSGSYRLARIKSRERISLYTGNTKPISIYCNNSSNYLVVLDGTVHTESDNQTYMNVFRYDVPSSGRPSYNYTQKLYVSSNRTLKSYKNTWELSNDIVLTTSQSTLVPRTQIVSENGDPTGMDFWYDGSYRWAYVVDKTDKKFYAYWLNNEGWTRIEAAEKENFPSIDVAPIDMAFLDRTNYPGGRAYVVHTDGSLRGFDFCDAINDGKGLVYEPSRTTDQIDGSRPTSIAIIPITGDEAGLGWAYVGHNDSTKPYRAYRVTNTGFTRVESRETTISNWPSAIRSFAWLRVSTTDYIYILDSQGFDCYGVVKTSGHLNLVSSRSVDNISLTVNPQPTGLAFYVSGGKTWAYITDNGFDKVFVYEVGSSGFTRTTASKAREFDLVSDNSNPTGIAFWNDLAFVLDNDDDKAYCYKVTSTGATNVIERETPNLVDDNDNATGIAFLGNVAYVVDFEPLNSGGEKTKRVFAYSIT